MPGDCYQGDCQRGGGCWMHPGPTEARRRLNAQNAAVDRETTLRRRLAALRKALRTASQMARAFDVPQVAAGAERALNDDTKRARRRTS